MSVAPPRPLPSDPRDSDEPSGAGSVASDTATDVAWAGRVVFPRSPAELRSTAMCPACQSPLRDARCPRCRLDLRQPSAIELATVSQQAADLLDARVALIGRIRRESAGPAIAAPAPLAASAAAATAAVPPVPPPVPAPARPSEPLPTAPAGSSPSAAPAPPIPTPPAAMVGGSSAPRGRSGIQVALTVVGISLLSIFAIFGIVYAFVTYGEAVRLTIIAAGTLATLAAATALARRGLTSTAEGIALLGTVILVLDAWALRANDPATFAGVTEVGYWGAALIIVGLVCAAWSRLSGLGAPSIAAAALTPLGAGLRAAEAASPLDPTAAGALLPTTSDAIGAMVAILVALAHPLLARPDRPSTARAVSIVALVVALGSAWVGMVSTVLGVESSGTVLLLSAGVAAGVAGHVIVLARTATAVDRIRSTGAAIAASVAVTTAVIGATVAASRLEQPELAVASAVLTATLLVVLLERRAGGRAGFVTAAVLATIAGGIAAVLGLGAALEAGFAGLAPFGVTPTSTIVDPPPIVPIALASLAAALGLLAARWWQGGVLLDRASALTPATGTLATASIPLLGTWWPVVTTAAVAALGAAIALRRALRVDDAPRRRAIVAGLAPVAVGGALLALVVAPAVDGAWIIGVVVALVTIAICRAARPGSASTAAAVGIGAAIVVASAIPLADDLARVGVTAAVSALALALGSLVVLVASLGSLPVLERRTASGTAAALAALALLDPIGGGGLGASTPVALAATGLAVAALTAVVAQAARSPEGGAAPRRLETLVASALLPAAAALLAVSALLELPSLAVGTGALVAALATVVVVGVNLASDLTAPRLPRRRTVTDVSAGLLLAGILMTQLGDGLADDRDALRPMLLLAAAVAVLLMAASRDGIAGSRSPRRHLGWLALALGVGALWVHLAAERVADPEPFVLPVAGALLAVAAWIARARSTPPPTAESTAASSVASSVALLSAGAIVLAGAPIALASGDASIARELAIAVLAAPLALLVAHRRDALDRAVTGLARALAAASLVVLAALALGQSIELAATTPDTGDELRAVLLVVVLAGVGLGAWFAEPSRERDAITAGGIGFAALTAGALGVARAVDPIELLALPVALGALAIGTIALERDERARSGRWLGPGLTLLLVPSLIAVERDPELWRIVALGIAATAVFVGGVVRGLRAPVLIGGTVLLVHLLVQSWPLLERIGESVEWWLWLGLAGIIVVAIAARYERRLQDARALVRRIRDLR